MAVVIPESRSSHQYSPVIAVSFIRSSGGVGWDGELGVRVSTCCAVPCHYSGKEENGDDFPPHLYCEFELRTKMKKWGIRIPFMRAKPSGLQPELVYEMVPNVSREEEGKMDAEMQVRLDNIQQLASNGQKNRDRVVDMYNLVKQHSLKRRYYEVLLGYHKDDRITFINWHSWLLLHVWMINVRGRGEGLWWSGKLNQRLMDTLWMDAERIMMEEIGFQNVLMVSREMKRLTKEYMGAMVAYDEALLKGSDKVLAEALFRNLFKESELAPHREWDISHLGKTVQYVRHQMYLWDQIDSDLFAEGFIPFLKEI